MKAVAVYPGTRRVSLIDAPEPQLTSPDDLKIEMLDVGICGTDRELVSFVYGTPPPGSDHFILGHESLGRVTEAGPGVEGVQLGDLVVAGVRVPCDEASCLPCRSGHQDFCASGRCRERGITKLHGFMAERIVQNYRDVYTVPRELRTVGVLTEPLTIAEKALQEVTRIQQRFPWKITDKRALVLGAGPIGLLGAMLLIQAGYRTWIYSRSAAPNRKARIAELIGATYLSSSSMTVREMFEEVGQPDVVYEAAGATQVAFDVLRDVPPNSTFVFTGIPRDQGLEAFQTLPTISNLVLNNQVVMGTVNAGRQAFLDATRDLSIFAARWPGVLESLITARYPMQEFEEPLHSVADAIKSVITISESN